MVDPPPLLACLDERDGRLNQCTWSVSCLLGRDGHQRGSCWNRRQESLTNATTRWSDQYLGRSQTCNSCFWRDCLGVSFNYGYCKNGHSYGTNHIAFNTVMPQLKCTAITFPPSLSGFSVTKRGCNPNCEMKLWPPSQPWRKGLFEKRVARTTTGTKKDGSSFEILLRHRCLVGSVLSSPDRKLSSGFDLRRQSCCDYYV
jgi:hypothetical protein